MKPQVKYSLNVSRIMPGDNHILLFTAIPDQSGVFARMDAESLASELRAKFPYPEYSVTLIKETTNFEEI